MVKTISNRQEWTTKFEQTDLPSHVGTNNMNNFSNNFKFGENNQNEIYFLLCKVPSGEPNIISTSDMLNDSVSKAKEEYENTNDVLKYL